VRRRTAASLGRGPTTDSRQPQVLLAPGTTLARRDSSNAEPGLVGMDVGGGGTTTPASGWPRMPASEKPMPGRSTAGSRDAAPLPLILAALLLLLLLTCVALAASLLVRAAADAPAAAA
jgi:hypothetical protein